MHLNMRALSILMQNKSHAQSMQFNSHESQASKLSPIGPEAINILSDHRDSQTNYN